MLTAIALLFNLKGDRMDVGKMTAVVLIFMGKLTDVTKNFLHCAVIEIPSIWIFLVVSVEKKNNENAN